MNKLLIAYDGSEAAKRALDTAIELAAAFHARVGVISVVPFHPGHTSIEPGDDASAHDSELREAKAVLGEHGIEPELFAPAGDPARMIERVAREGGFDTIVMGSRGLGTLERVLQGSVSEHVIAHSGATVVVVH